MPTSAYSKNKCVADGSPVSHRTLRQQGGTGEESHIHLADWTLSVAAIDWEEEEDHHICAHVKDSQTLLSGHTKILHTLVGIGSAVRIYIRTNRRRRRRKRRRNAASRKNYFIISLEKLDLWLNIYHITVDNNTHCIF